jgi:hypothetical protein
VASLPATRVVRQLLLFSGLLFRALVCPAADGLQTAPTAHGPLVMLYIRQPLGAHGASRVYGLRLEHQASVPTQPAALPGAMPGTMAGTMAGQREIVDLQIRHYSDVRVEFGRRVTWNIGRHEFGPSANQPSMAIRLPMPAMPTAVVAHALP